MTTDPELRITREDINNFVSWLETAEEEDPYEWYWFQIRFISIVERKTPRFEKVWIFCMGPSIEVSVDKLENQTKFRQEYLKIFNKPAPLISKREWLRLLKNLADPVNKKRWDEGGIPP